MRKSPLRKRSKRPISKLKREAWRLFSIYIRQKYADKNGMVTCFTCGERKNWKIMQAGHYVSRQYNSLLFSEFNVHPQCQACNIFKHGHLDAYALHLSDTYGAGILKELGRKKRELKQWKAEELEALIEKYAKEVQEN